MDDLQGGIHTQASNGTLALSLIVLINLYLINNISILSQKCMLDIYLQEHILMPSVPYKGHNSLCVFFHTEISKKCLNMNHTLQQNTNYAYLNVF